MKQEGAAIIVLCAVFFAGCRNESQGVASNHEQASGNAHQKVEIAGQRAGGAVASSSPAAPAPSGTGSVHKELASITPDANAYVETARQIDELTPKKAELAAELSELQSRLQSATEAKAGTRVEPVRPAPSTASAESQSKLTGDLKEYLRLAASVTQAEDMDRRLGQLHTQILGSIRSAAKGIDDGLNISSSHPDIRLLSGRGVADPFEELRRCRGVSPALNISENLEYVVRRTGEMARLDYSDERAFPNPPLQEIVSAINTECSSIGGTLTAQKAKLTIDFYRWFFGEITKELLEARTAKVNELQVLTNNKQAELSAVEAQYAPLASEADRLRPSFERFKVIQLQLRREEEAAQAREEARQEKEQAACEREMAAADTQRRGTFMDYKIICVNRRIDQKMRASQSGG